MQKGKVVEAGDARAVLDNPQHPYSILLKSSVLSPDVATGGPSVPTASQPTPPVAARQAMS